MLQALVDEGEEVVLPSIVLAERRRQLVRDGRDPEELLTFVEMTGFAVEAFGIAEAFLMPAPSDALWRRHARDTMTAAHVREGDVLWTTNPRDFLALGLAPAQVRGI